jgi:hypothetical protein
VGKEQQSRTREEREEAMTTDPQRPGKRGRTLLLARMMAVVPLTLAASAAGIVAAAAVIAAPASAAMAATGDAGHVSAFAVPATSGPPYNVTTNPSPVQLNSLISSLTLSANDAGTGVLIPGTFTLTDGSGTYYVASGTSVSNIVVTPLGYTIVTFIGTDGKPHQIRVPICPKLTFDPTNPEYSTYSSALC